MEDTRHWAALALSPEEKMAVEDPLEMERLADAIAGGARRLALDRVDAIRTSMWRRFAPTSNMGFRHLVFHAPGPDQARFINLYADQVLPRLRAAFD